MTAIPGLSFCPADDSLGVEISSFEGKIIIPGSHWLGHCRTVNDFEKFKCISKGSFGEIYKCKMRGTDETYTLKKHADGDYLDGTPSSLLREITLLSSLNHKNVIRFFGTVAGKFESNFLILEYCPVSLNDLIEKKVSAIYAYDVVKCIMKQLFEGLIYIHEALVVHRDINDKNIVFREDGVLKITGFNASRDYSKENMTPNVSELAFRAPELFFKVKRYSYAIDIWSTGCLFARLLLKKPLFYGTSELDVLRTIFMILGIPSKNIWPGFDKLSPLMSEATKIMKIGAPYSELKSFFMDQPISCYDLIKNMLIYYPAARYSAKECSKSTYITELPSACSLEKLASILKDVLPPDDSNVESKVDTNFFIV